MHFLNPYSKKRSVCHGTRDRYETQILYYFGEYIFHTDYDIDS